MEKLDQKGELVRERHLVASSGIEVPRNIMRFEGEPRAHLEEALKGGRRLAAATEGSRHAASLFGRRPRGKREGPR
jgi:hypothetical protein